MEVITLKLQIPNKNSKAVVTILLVLSIMFVCQSVLSADIAALKLDAAKRASCSKITPCSINYKGHNGEFVVKVNSVKITESGIININHAEYRRFIYKNGIFSHEITTN